MSPGNRHEPEVNLEAGDLNIGNVDIASTLYRTDVVEWSRVDVNLSGGNATELITAVSGEKIYVVEMLLTVDTQCELEFTESGAPTTAAPPFYLPAYGGIFMPDAPGFRFVTDAANEGLDLDEVDGVSVKVRGYIKYYTA